MRKGRKSLRETVALVVDALDTRLPVCLKNTLKLLWERYQFTLAQLKETKAAKAALVKQVEPCRLRQHQRLEDSFLNKKAHIRTQLPFLCKVRVVK